MKGEGRQRRTGQEESQKRPQQSAKKVLVRLMGRACA